jgi:cell division protease FtsH
MDVVRARSGVAGAIVLFAISLALVPSAGAQTGAATCASPVGVARGQQVGGLSLSKGHYRVTVLDNRRLSCPAATARLRAFLVRGELPAGWRASAATLTFRRGLVGFRLNRVGAGGGGFSFQDIQDWAVVWLPIIFMAAIVAALGLTLRWMPRTKPQQINPSSASSVRWPDVAGVEEAKEELREVVEFLRDPKRFRSLGARVPKGILLHGPPGTGKTLLAKAVAHESKAEFFAQSASSFVEMFAGLGAARIRRLFREARKAAPAIVFIDELDAVGATRGHDVSGEKDQTLNQLLVELDGFADRDELVVIAASNLLEKLDPALLRPGRFDRQIFVAAPDLRGRRAILDVHSRDKPLQEVDLDLVARQTSGLTGADLANICNEAAIFAGRDHRSSILTADFQGALERVIAGMQSRRVITEQEKRVVAYHEAGHALCSELLPSVEQVHRISVIPRGQALGYTLNLPEEDRYLKTKEELFDYLVVLLGGRVTEQTVFGSVTTGAADDLRKVHEISLSMVTEYGMGTALQSKRVPTGDYSVSDATRRMVDEEQQEIADLAHRRALQLISEHRELLDALALTLLDQEVLEREDIDRLVASHRGEAATSRRSEVVGIGRERARVAASERIDAPGAD